MLMGCARARGVECDAHCAHKEERDITSGDVDGETEPSSEPVGAAMLLATSNPS